MARPDAALRLLGLAARAGAVVTGTERVREGVRDRSLGFVLVAADASENSHDKLIPTLQGSGIPFAVRYERVQLGDAVGRSPLSAVGLLDASFAARLQQLIRDEDGM